MKKSFVISLLMNFPENIDAMFIANPITIGHQTGFWGSFGRLLVLPTHKILISDSRYEQVGKSIAQQKKNILFRLFEKKESFLSDLMQEFEIKTLGIEKEHTTLDRYELLKKSFSKINLVPLSSEKQFSRTIKTKEEIEKIQTAAHIADKALAKTVAQFKEGITEKELAWIFEKTAREEYHAEGLSFDTIVAFGENSASAHHFSSDKKLSKNTPILIDCGVKFERYCSDMTRCFWFGEPSGDLFEQWETMYQLVLNAQLAGIAEMKANNPIQNAEKKAREIFGEQESLFSHSFGHGVGLEIHEAPHVSSKNTEVFETGMIVTAEPGIYLEGKFGIRIEDLLLIDGENAHLLSGYKKTSFLQ